jgi:hypothetical protein
VSQKTSDSASIPPIAPPIPPVAPPVTPSTITSSPVSARASIPANPSPSPTPRRVAPVLGHAQLTPKSPSNAEKSVDSDGVPFFDFKTWLKSVWEKFAIRETPSWLASLMVHLAIILMLAIVPLSQKLGSTIRILSGESETLGEEDVISTQLQSPEDTLEVMDVSSDQLSLDTLKLDEAVPMPPTLSSDDLKIESPVRSGLTGRVGPLKEALLKAYGGTQGTEDAVASGLKWLAKQQRSDGSWSLVGPYRGGASSENKPAASAMALLAFLGAGNTHKSGEYQNTVNKGLKYILSLQDEDGFFAQTAVGNQRTYAQAQCTIAICELYGMTADESLEPIAMKAIRYAQDAQGKNGGWRYAPKEPGDMSVTGWYVMALMSARMGGLLVDSDVLENVHKFLDLVQRTARGNNRDPEGDRYAYQSYAASTPAMTAEGMLCRLYLGWAGNDRRIEKGSEMLCNNPVSRAENRRSFYYWYYATTTLHHIGGDYWRRWNDEMKVELPALQEKSGSNQGSWSAEDDPHEGGGGRLYSTCFAIYCLETYYRHLPLNSIQAERE